jgi:hypothetical protein
MNKETIDYKFRKYKSKLEQYQKININMNGGALKIGDKVVIRGLEAYGYRQNYSGSTGVIFRIRHRYSGTPYEYNQYQVHIDGYPFPNPNSLEFIFDEMSIELLQKYTKEKISVGLHKFTPGDKVKLISAKGNTFSQEFLGQEGVISYSPNGEYVMFEKKYNQDMYVVLFSNGRVLEILEENLVETINTQPVIIPTSQSYIIEEDDEEDEENSEDDEDDEDDEENSDDDDY